MTLFLVINPDQTHPFERNINESKKNSTGKVFVTSAEQQLKGFLSRKEFPLFSTSYEKEQCFHYQIIREIVVNGMKHNPNERWSFQKILKVFNESIDYLPLTVSQATAMEINDRNIVQGCLKLPNSSVPLNDGTNACAFLAISVIDNCSSLSIFDPNILTNEKILTITEFPKKFNPHRNVQECVDIYEAYSILNCNNLSENTFAFTEKLVDNLLLYSQAIQKQMYQELEELLSVSISTNKSHFALFQANIYIFTFGTFSSGDIVVLETHPISSDLGGNGNGIIVRSKSSVALWQWVLKRLNNSGVKETCTPYFVTVELR